MILKRTKSLKQTSAAMAWVGGYLDEVEKHHGTEAHRFRLAPPTSPRPAGLLTAHGYIRRAVDELRRQRADNPDLRTTNNQAIQEFVRRHCRAQREKKRKTIGLRFIASLDPAQVKELIPQQLDLDRLLIAAIERTFERLGRKHYPGDELGFIIGVHHDALDRFSRPHLHAHVFLLPQTRKGTLVSVSNHSRPGRDGHYANMLAETTDLFREAAFDLIYTPTPNRYQTFASQDWDDLARECSLLTVETVAAARPLPPDQTRKLAANRFFLYLRRTTAPWLQRRLQKLKHRIAELKTRSRTELTATARDLVNGLRRLTLPRMAERRQLTARLMETMAQNRVRCRTADCDLQQIRTCLAQWRTVANRRPQIEPLLQEIDRRRLAARISMLGEAGLIDLHLAAADVMPNPPGWLQRLELGAQDDRLANRRILELAKRDMVAAPEAKPSSNLAPVPKSPAVTASSIRHPPPRF